MVVIVIVIDRQNKKTADLVAAPVVHTSAEHHHIPSAESELSKLARAERKSMQDSVLSVPTSVIVPTPIEP